MSTDRAQFKCRLCGIVATFRLPWQGRPQGPQCQCNPNTWGNWQRLPTNPAQEPPCPKT